MAYSIDYLYRIIDKFSPILNKMTAAGKKFDKTVAKIQGSLGRMEDKFKSAGAKMANLQTGLASLGAGVFLKSTLNEAKQFQQSLNLTKAVTGSTTDQMEMMRAKALEWGASTQFSSLQVSQAMAELGKMGNDTEKILGLMPGTMALAAAGEISMAEAANYTMATINQMGLNISDAEMIADTFAAGASNAATSVAGLASAFANTGLQARMSGLSVKETTAALMGLAGANMEGAVGGTMMMNALKGLEKMSGTTRKGFEDLGIDIDNFRDSTSGQMTDFFGLIKAMKEANVTGVQLGKMFELRGKKAMAALVGLTTEKLQGFRDAVSDTTGAAAEMQDTLLDGLKPFVEFESVTQNLKVIMGSFLMEGLAPVIEKFNEWLGNMQKNNPTTLKWITYLLMGVTALGAVLIPLGLMISAMGSLIGALKLAMGITKLFGIAQAVFAGIMGTSGVALANTTIATNAYVFGAKIATIAQWLFNAAVTAFPVIAIVMGIIAIVAAIIWMVKNWDLVKAKMKEWALATLGFVKKVWNKFNELLENPFFTAALLIFAPWLTIPVMIIKYWTPLKAFFIDLWEKVIRVIDAVKSIGGGIGDFFGGVGDFLTGGGEAGTAHGTQMTEAQSPYDRGGANATANASVSVYTEKGMGTKPFVPSGDLGYNMATASRGM